MALLPPILPEKEEWYNDLPCGYLTTSVDGIILEVNETFLKIIGCTRDEIISKCSFQEFLSIGSKMYYETHYRPLLQMQGIVTEVNLVFIRRDESQTHALVNTKQIKNKQSLVNQIMIFEITQRKVYEQELFLMKEKAEALAEELRISNENLVKQSHLVRSQNERLEVLNETKDKFFGIVCHDLRSPLNSLKSLTYLLLRQYDSLTQAQISKMMSELNHSLEGTIKLADNLITWASLQMREAKACPETVSMDELLTPILGIYKAVYEAKEIRVNYQLADGLKVYSDPNQLAFIVRNLLSNAIKFTPVGGSISIVGTYETDHHLRLLIKDSGAGIPKHIADKLFSMMAKSTRGTEGEEGNGIGLMLCKQFVEMNKGDISFSTDKEGTVFSLLLPANV